MEDEILLVLDLDETLIHATKIPKHEQWDFEIGPYKVFKRPGLDVFLAKIKHHFRIAIWSSASDDYVKEVVKKIIPPSYSLTFVWGRSECSLKIDAKVFEDSGFSDYYNHLNYVKPLKKVKKKGFSTLEQMLILDDTPQKSRLNYGNAIYPREFLGSPDDNELEMLLPYLISLKSADNVRTIEKRFWRKSQYNLKKVT